MKLSTTRPTPSTQALPSGPVQVIDRVDSLVQVYSPETGECFWVDLAEIGHRPASAPSEQ